MTHTRPMTKADLRDVAAVIDAVDLFPSEMLPDMANGYIKGTAPDLWRVATAGTDVIGVGYCAPERMTEGTWNLFALAVHPDFQGQGFGYALIDETRTALRALNARLLVIETLDTPDFAAQRAFYEQAGLTKTAHFPEYYGPGAGKVTFRQML